MAIVEPIDAPPILGIEDGSIVLAAVVTARIKQLGKVFIEVATWEAGQGQRVDWLTPAGFADWRRSFVRPEVTD